MRSIPAACLLALSPALALAGIVPGATTVAGSGPYTWTYQLQLADGSSADTNEAPFAGDHGGAFTLLGFAGYVGASCASPDGWTCTVLEAVSADGDDGAPEGAATVSLTWAYVRGPVLGGLPSGRVLGDFSAQSIYGAAGEVGFAARTVGNNSPRNGSTSANAGTVVGPSPGPVPVAAAAPGPDGPVDATEAAVDGAETGVAAALAVNEVAEPGALALAGLGLVALGLTSRRARRRQGV